MRSLAPLVVLLPGLALVGGCGPEAGNVDDPPATPVGVAVAVEGPAAPPIRTNGVIANRDEIRLSFKVAGIIRTIAVQEGERVRKGQLLAEIELTEIEAQVRQAREAHAKAQRDVERGERLYADSVISLEQLEDLRTQAAVAEAALRSAEFNRGYAAIVAPHDGVILRRLAEERELVSAGSPILVLGAADGGFVLRTGLADREVVQVKLGDPAEIRLDALPGVVLHGRVTELASAADPATGMFGVEVSIDSQSDAPLRSGLVAKLELTPASAKSGSRVYVPIDAIVEADGRVAHVYVLDGRTARRRDVEVAFIEGERVALADGLAAGERVITDGAPYLEDGELVAIAETLAERAGE